MTLAKGTPTIIKGSDHFFTTTYEGTGGGQKVGKFVPFTDNGTIAKSVIYNRADEPKLSKTPSGTSNTKTFTISVWFKPGNLGTRRQLFSAGTDGSNYAIFEVNNNNKIYFTHSSQGDVITTRTLEDTSKFYHILFAMDTTQSTASNRLKIYIDGDQITSFDSSTYPSQDFTTFVNNSSYPHAVGSFAGSFGSSLHMSGYLAEFNFVDGTALTPSTFGLTDTSTGRWIPKSLTGITYGTNGFRMQFANSAGQTIGDDTSGEGNDYAVTNLAATDIVTDSPTQNFATFDPLDSGNNAGATPGTATLAEGNTRITAGSNPSNWDQYRTNKPLTSGKWYVEVTLTSLNTASYFGVISRNQNIKGGGWYSDQSTGWSYDTSNGKTENSNNGYISYGSARSQGHVVGIAVDLDNGKLWFSEQGTYPNSGNPVTGANPAYSNLKLAVLDGGLCFTEARGYSGHNDWNFGQRSYAHTPPTGFSAVQQDNYPDQGVKPDLVWIKNRDAGDNHQMYDSSRGVQQVLTTEAGAESTVDDGLQKFLQGGCAIEDDVSINTVAESYVAWNWVANGGTTSANTDGSGASIASTVQANQTAGFSIVTYTGTGSAGTIAHGLSSAPEWVMASRRTDSSGDGWTTYHTGLTNANYWMDTRQSNAQSSASTVWNGTAPTNKVFSVGTSSGTNTSSKTYVAYCWHSVDGFSKFGSYSGNGSTNGPCVNLGFKPAWLMIKRRDSSTGGNWSIIDNTRYRANPIGTPLLADTTDAESGLSAITMDLLSNGFKIRNTLNSNNNSSGTYVYMAFAEHPFIGNGTNPVTAR